MKPKNTVCLCDDGTALDAAKFSAETFPDRAVGPVYRAPGDCSAGKEGDVLTVAFSVLGVPRLGLNGGPACKHDGALSFPLATDDQAWTDCLWTAVVANGGQGGQHRTPALRPQRLRADGPLGALANPAAGHAAQIQSVKS